jgi:hypothetical protein
MINAVTEGAAIRDLETREDPLEHGSAGDGRFRQFAKRTRNDIHSSRRIGRTLVLKWRQPLQAIPAPAHYSG